MVYSQAKVIAGGLAHIPIVISVFYFVMTTFNKRALKFAETNKSIKLKSKVVESKTKSKPLIAVEAKTEEVKETEVKDEKAAREAEKIARNAARANAFLKKKQERD